MRKDMYNPLRIRQFTWIDFSIEYQRDEGVGVERGGRQAWASCRDPEEGQKQNEET